MSDIILNNTKPITIKYSKSLYGFSDSNSNSNKYLFELIIKGVNIGTMYFKNIEDIKYSHLIKLHL